jgi:peptidoglycan L-alanyl-D-glutamate endopeptidase CwlK
MANYGKQSLKALSTCHPDLVTLFKEVVRVFDNSVIYGNRSITEQFELYKKGRELINKQWVITDKNKVVTYKDGKTNLSNHNYTPSHAVDAIPYPLDWSDDKRMCYFAGYVMATAIRLKLEGKITHDIRWGGDWNQNTEIKDESFRDYCHFEII